MKTGNKDLDDWIVFFNKDKKSMTKYISMLNKCDKSFLTKGVHQDIDEENLLPLNGMLEKDFLNILKNSKNMEDSFTRLVLAAIHGVNFETWKSLYKEKLFDVFEKSLIEGQYEMFNVEFEKIISIFIKKELIGKNSFMALSVLRGMFLSKKYNSPVGIKRLNRQKMINKWKIKIGL